MKPGDTMTIEIYENGPAFKVLCVLWEIHFRTYHDCNWWETIFHFVRIFRLKKTKQNCLTNGNGTNQQCIPSKPFTIFSPQRFLFYFTAMTENRIWIVSSLLYNSIELVFVSALSPASVLVERGRTHTNLMYADKYIQARISERDQYK